MKSSINAIIALISILVILAGCMKPQVPVTQVWRPWSRISGQANEVKVGSRVKVVSEGVTEPRLGSEALLSEQLSEQARSLLSRRGYIIVRDSFDFIIELKYKTDQATEEWSHQSMYATQFQSNSEARLFGYGVALAKLLSAQAGTMAISSTNVKSTFFRHSIALEVKSLDEKLIWKGESSWQTESIDLLERSRTAIQILLSGLPTDSSAISSIDELKSTHYRNYLDVVCLGKTFSCPALDSWIYFSKELEFFEGLGGSSVITAYPPDAETQTGWAIISGNDHRALACFVDLIQTAEYALPTGQNDRSNPLNPSLWTSATLGSRYYLGADKKEINVMVELIGRKEGYRIERAWLSSNEEYAEFEKQMIVWEKTLSDYFDMFRTTP